MYYLQHMAARLANFYSACLVLSTSTPLLSTSFLCMADFYPSAFLLDCTFCSYYNQRLL